MDNDREIIELTGENGDSIKCEYLDTVLVEGKEYVVKDADIMHFRFNV